MFILIDSVVGGLQNLRADKVVIVETIIQMRIIWFAQNLLIATNELQAVQWHLFAHSPPSSRSSPPVADDDEATTSHIYK